MRDAEVSKTLASKK